MTKDEISKLIKELLPDEIQELIIKLEETDKIVRNEKNTCCRYIHRAQDILICPHCSGKNIIKNGHTKNNIQKYRCKECGKEFNDATNTIFARSKLSYNIWMKFIECMKNKFSLRKIQNILKINKNTALFMRHKICSLLGSFQESYTLSGEIELDEKYESINLKGTKKINMPRASKPRQSHGGSKRGISNHQICIATAKDELDHIIMKIVGNGPITSEMIKKVFNNRISSGSILITDCKSSYEAFAKENNFQLEQIKSGTYKNDNGYTLSEINSVHSNFNNFIKPFRGVSIKYLQNYINWFIYQQNLNYTKEEKEQNDSFFQYLITSKGNYNYYNVMEIDLPVNVFEIYKDYHFISSVTN